LLSAGWLSDLAPGLAEAVLDACYVRRFADREIVYGHDSDTRALYGVLDGAVRMLITTSEQPLRLGHVAGPGFWFGDPGFVLGIGRLLEIEAAGGTRLPVLRRDAFDRLARTRPEAWEGLARLSVKNSMLAMAAADDLLIREPRRRLVATLLRLASRRGARPDLPPLDTIPILQRELADVVNTARSSAAKTIAGLVAEGAVETSYRAIRILDPDALERILREDAPAGG
jgi:CRP-like cAMP-binding protein